MLSDDLLLSQVSLPGTHNSVALHGIDLARCQAKSMEQQLAMGIRFFDLRIKLKHHRLLMYHGIVFQRLDFTTVVMVMIEFLIRHPSEFLVVRIKNEHKNCTQLEKKRIR